LRGPPEGYPNLYASIAATVNFIRRQRWVVAAGRRKAMRWGGEDKTIYVGRGADLASPMGTGRPSGTSNFPAASWRSGYPQLTEQAKRKTLRGPG